MKLSLAGIVALLATAAIASPIEAPIEATAAWNCPLQDGESSHGSLRFIHNKFNTLFGAPRLRMAYDQCYVARCEGYYFGVCNKSNGPITEVSGARDVAKNADPGRGSSCAIYPNGPNLRYIYGHYSGPIVGGKITERKCPPTNSAGEE